MATATVDGRALSYEVIGEQRPGGRPWAITPGGRASKDEPGIRDMAEALAERGNQVLIWSRPNTGASDVCFEGDTESEMQADALAGLLRHLDLAPAVVVGGSGGSRVSLLTAARHPDVAAALALWWISGGTYGLMSVGNHYCNATIRAAWQQGMEAVADLPEWQAVCVDNPGNRQRILDQDPDRFVETFERWMLAYCPCGDELVPGLPFDQARAMTIPTLVLRSGASDIHHRRATSEQIADVLPDARLVEPPWDDGEWHERQAARTSGASAGLFVRWNLLVPMLTEWADEVLR